MLPPALRFNFHVNAYSKQIQTLAASSPWSPKPSALSHCVLCSLSYSLAIYWHTSSALSVCKPCEDSDSCYLPSWRQSLQQWLSVKVEHTLTSSRFQYTPLMPMSYLSHLTFPVMRTHCSLPEGALWPAWPAGGARLLGCQGSIFKQSVQMPWFTYTAYSLGFQSGIQILLTMNYSIFLFLFPVCPASLIHDAVWTKYSKDARVCSTDSFKGLYGVLGLALLSISYSWFNVSKYFFFWCVSWILSFWAESNQANNSTTEKWGRRILPFLKRSCALRGKDRFLLLLLSSLITGLGKGFICHRKGL